jgi:hypothetical protein
MASLSTGSVQIGPGTNQTVAAYSVQFSGAGGGGGDDTIDVTTLSSNSIVSFARPLRASGAAGATYSVTVEYFGTSVSTNNNITVVLPVLGTKSGCTISSSSTTYGVNDVIRGSATILVP